MEFSLCSSSRLWCSLLTVLRIFRKIQFGLGQVQTTDLLCIPALSTVSSVGFVEEDETIWRKKKFFFCINRNDKFVKLGSLSQKVDTKDHVSEKSQAVSGVSERCNLGFYNFL